MFTCIGQSSLQYMIILSPTARTPPQGGGTGIKNLAEFQVNEDHGPLTSLLFPKYPKGSSPSELSPSEFLITQYVSTMSPVLSWCSATKENNYGFKIIFKTYYMFSFQNYKTSLVLFVDYQNHKEKPTSKRTARVGLSEPYISLMSNISLAKSYLKTSCSTSILKTAHHKHWKATKS